MNKLRLLFRKWFFNLTKSPSIEKKNLYIHIGMGKTGTSALQNFFYMNKAQLSNIGVSYPDYGIVAGAHHLLSPHKPQFLLGQFNFIDTEKWQEVFKSDPNDNILISSELISSASSECIGEFCESLKKIFNIYVVVYLRRQDDAIMATYNQLVKTGVQKRHIQKTIENQYSRYDYLGKLSVWERYVGKENVFVRPYEHGQFYKGDIFHDFLFHVFRLEGEGFCFGQMGNSNPRLSAAALEYKRGINNLTEDTQISGRFNDVLLRYSEKSDRSSVEIHVEHALLSRQQRQDILEYYRLDNLEISKRYNGSLPLFHKMDVTDLGSEAKLVAIGELIKITKFIKNFDSKLFKLLVILGSEFVQDDRKGLDVKAALTIKRAVQSVLD